jgi:hypothetical protein
MVFFFFQKKKQKALFCSAENHTQPKTRRSRLWGSAGLIVSFFFQKKKQKALVLRRRRSSTAQISAKPTLGVWGHAPKKPTTLIVFPEKESKSVVLLRQ